MSTVTYYHYPKCSTSRKGLELLREQGVKPTIIEYLNTPPSPDELLQLAQASGQPLRTFIRTKQPEYQEQDLARPELTDRQLAEAMHATPILIERPIAASAKAVRLGRPVERVLEVV